MKFSIWTEGSIVGSCFYKTKQNFHHWSGVWMMIHNFYLCIFRSCCFDDESYTSFVSKWENEKWEISLQKLHFNHKTAFVLNKNFKWYLIWIRGVVFIIMVVIVKPMSVSLYILNFINWWKIPFSISSSYF